MSDMFWSKTITNNKQTVLLTVFFGFLGIGLFLGDGIQNIIDLWLIAETIFLYLLAAIFGLRRHPIDKKHTLIWLALITFVSVRTLFSDSVGLSITYIARLLIAFSVFYFFSSFFDKKQIPFFARLLLRFTILACIVALGLILLPALSYQLPSLNLLYAAYGHNHLASLLLFAFPLALRRATMHPTLTRITVLFFLLVTLLMTFARGTLLLVSGYFLIWFWFKARKKSKKAPLYGLTALLIVLFSFSLIGISILKIKLPSDFSVYWLKRQVFKEASPLEARQLYWKQALKAFVDQPLFGHGPGTFSLLSKRYQEEADQHSYYAHSFPLEILAESGLVGTLLWLILIGVLLREVLSVYKQNKENIYVCALIESLFLTLVYSFIDFNFNFLIISFLFWSTLGLVLSSYKQSQRKQHKPVLASKIMLSILFVYYFLNLITILLSTLNDSQYKKITFYLTPFDRLRTIKFLDDLIARNEVISNNLPIIFHRKDAEVLTKYIKIYENEPNSFKKQASLFRQIVTYDPKNTQNYIAFFELNKQQPIDIFTDMFIYLNEYNIQKKQLLFLIQLETALQTHLNKNALYTILSEVKPRSPFDVNEYLARIAYKLGLTMADSEPLTTKTLWVIAITLDPNISYYAVELANLYVYKFSDMDSAIEVLRKCQESVSAKNHCIQVEKDLTNGEYEKIPPLFYYKDIL